MNYLGHLFFSNNDVELMYYNLFGDYVKGSDLSRFPEKVQQGLRLHREIDDYIDTHHAVLELLHEMYPELPKISGVAVDLYFDHLLAKNWNDYHPQQLESYLEAFYNHTPEHAAVFTEEFKYVLKRMINGKWMNHYSQFEGLETTCKNLSARIPFENVLYKAPEVFADKKEIIEGAFKKYMQDAILRFNG